MRERSNGKLQLPPKNIYLRRPLLKKIKRYLLDIKDSLRHHRTINLHGSGSGVLIAIRLAEKLHSANEAWKISASIGISEGDRTYSQITLRMRRRYRGQGVPQLLSDAEQDIHEVEVPNSRDLESNVQEAKKALLEHSKIMLRGTDRGVLEAIILSDKLEKTDEALEISTTTSTESYHAKIGIVLVTAAQLDEEDSEGHENCPRASGSSSRRAGFQLGSKAQRDLRIQVAENWRKSREKDGQPIPCCSPLSIL